MTGDNDPIAPRPRTAKGPAADLLDCKDAERVLSLAMASAAEVSALYDRIDTLERFILTKLDGDPETLAALRGDDTAQEERQAWRRAFVGRLLRGLETELAGDDREYYAANAQLEDASVVVWSDAIPAPRFVRYAWRPFPRPPVNLINAARLPASPVELEVADDE